MGLKYFSKNVIDNIPRINYPDVNSNKFDNDLKEVVRCFNNPCMSTSFLRKSDDSVMKRFKDYCNESEINQINWKKIKEILEEFDSVIHYFKSTYNRARPANFINDDSRLSIKYKKSPSYPSGHTAIAYFLCDIISNEVPELQQDLQTLASLIGQSRIENAVHYPSDIEYGRLIGEMLAASFINENDFQAIDFKNKDKKFRKYILDKYEGRHACNLLSDFVYNNANLSGYSVKDTECHRAIKEYLSGYPLNYIGENKEINSQLNMISSAFNLDKIDTLYKLNILHKTFNEQSLSSGLPGDIRNYDFNHYGHACPKTYDIKDKIKMIMQIKHPFSKHLAFCWAKPFCDGNARINRILLLSDLEFDLAKANYFLENNYHKNINNFFTNNDIIRLLKM